MVLTIGQCIANYQNVLIIPQVIFDSYIEKVLLRADCILFNCSPACGVHLNPCLSMVEGGRKGLLMDKGKPKNQPHQIILGLDLTGLNFNGLLIVDFFFFLKFNPVVSEGSMSVKLGLIQIIG